MENYVAFARHFYPKQHTADTVEGQWSSSSNQKRQLGLITAVDLLVFISQPSDQKLKHFTSLIDLTKLIIISQQCFQ